MQEYITLNYYFRLVAHPFIPPINTLTFWMSWGEILRPASAAQRPTPSIRVEQDPNWLGKLPKIESEDIWLQVR